MLQKTITNQNLYLFLAYLKMSSSNWQMIEKIQPDEIESESTESESESTW